MKSDSADMMSCHQIHTLCYMKVINECLSEFVQFRYRWDWKTCLLLYQGAICISLHGQAFGTIHVHIIAKSAIQV